jgi:hypothetical protein
MSTGGLRRDILENTFSAEALKALIVATGVVQASL